MRRTSSMAGNVNLGLQYHEPESKKADDSRSGYYGVLMTKMLTKSTVAATTSRAETHSGMRMSDLGEVGRLNLKPEVAAMQSRAKCSFGVLAPANVVPESHQLMWLLVVRGLTALELSPLAIIPQALLLDEHLAASVLTTSSRGGFEASTFSLLLCGGFPFLANRDRSRDAGQEKPHRSSFQRPVDLREVANIYINRTGFLSSLLLLFHVLHQRFRGQVPPVRGNIPPLH
ncbi:hypothetical protein BDY19DRAFT_1045314 [Irpex rosettiformis]|uniref:Uncharacterized protein n=1 Tax=Irpex rosettiformis TaxID=378272 RepID=A0ACB8UFA7_9APHY|nr:hypothetical protein BDY19DRAFT_1045314 [Irpex rosettiformis]